MIRTAIATTLVLAVYAGDAAPPRLARADIERQIVAYCAGGAEQRAQALAVLAPGDVLTAKEVPTWTKTILAKVRKAGPILVPKLTNMQARLSGPQLDFASHVPASLVAEVETASGTMRALVQSGKERAPAVLMYLHGGGNSPTHPGKLDNEMAWAFSSTKLDRVKGFPFRILPRCIDDEALNAWVKPEEARAVDAVLDALLRTSDVAPDRICLLGESMGGYGVWNMAALLGDRFAAIADATGGSSPARLENLRNVPFAVFIGADDTARAPSTKQGIAQIEALRAADPGGYLCAYNEYPGMGHGMKPEAWTGIETFFAGKVRNAYPRKVVWRPVVDWRRRFYNVAIAQPAAGQSVTAEMSTDNVVTVTSDQVTALTVYLSDALVDLDKDVQVRWNGRPAFSGKLQRRVGVMLETLAERCDAGMFYTAKVELTAP